ncbi:MAG: molybdopterin-synthase adenylyltransferase MoeB [Gammaproteobacteria bacterium]|nr:MAG: molybdopterin-synthase adenylyltransferase MoeB [Gammaproteobacteria bacterium]
MDHEMLLRYSRQILLPEIDLDGQEKLLASRVLIIGIGGLGSPVALYLAASGIGTLWLNDPDVVDITNLQRQIAHTTAQIKQPKVESAKQQIKALNPHINVHTLDYVLEGQNLLEAVMAVDVVVDATDNLESRLRVNQACVQSGTPLVSAAAIRWEGQISTFDSRQPESPCYQCLYGALGEVGQTCSENGVMGSVVGALGCMQATEVVKLLCHTGQPLIGRVLFYDALIADWRSIKLKRDSNCPVCGSHGTS